MTKHENPLKDKLVASVENALSVYDQGNPHPSDAKKCVAGIQLISYVQKGFLSAESKEDQEMLQTLKFGFHKPALFYSFLAKAKLGTFAVNEDAVAAAFN